MRGRSSSAVHGRRSASSLERSRALGPGRPFTLSVIRDMASLDTISAVDFGDVRGDAIVVCDGLKGSPEAVNKVWDHAVVQTL
jgi:hypothetical protein